MKELLWQSIFYNISTVLQQWNIEVKPSRYVNNELQSYIHDAVTCRDGELMISTIKHGHDITSGRLNTKGKLQIQYGYIEAEIKFGGGKGLWPAFWMMGEATLQWPYMGEVDIFEWVGWNNAAIYGTLHGPGYSGANSFGNLGKNMNKQLQNEYHKYALEWKRNSMKWYIDNILYFEANTDILQRAKPNTRWVFDDRPFYMVLNMAVGGDFGGGYNGYPNDVYDNLNVTTEMHIKYININKTDDGQGRVIISR